MRLLAALLCWLQLAGITPAAHASSVAGAAEHPSALCGHATLASIVALAGLAPDAFAKALRDQTGAGDGCCTHCAGAAPLPRAAVADALLLAPAAEQPPAAPVAAGAARFGAFKPPSTAPPALA